MYEAMFGQCRFEKNLRKIMIIYNFVWFENQNNSKWVSATQQQSILTVWNEELGMYTDRFRVKCCKKIHNCFQIKGKSPFIPK